MTPRHRLLKSTNFFKLLHLPQQFEIDIRVLEDHYRRLQREVHPDNYVSADPITRAQAALIASEINEAYIALKNPVHRAKHLLALQGVILENEPDQVPPVFLMQHLDWQEALEEAQDKATKNSILSEVQSKKSAALSRLEILFQSASTTEAIVVTLQIIYYLDRLLLNHPII